MSGEGRPRRWSGAVLTGGRSSRMGSDKALLDVAGTALAARVAGVLRDAGAADVRGVGGDASRLAAAGLPTVPDPRQGEGPLGGLVTALEALGAGVDAVLVVACDLPWLDVPTVTAVVAGLSHPGADVACATTDRRQPLCAAWRPSAARALQEAFDAGERAVHRAWERLSLMEVVVPAGALRDVDTPGDLPDGWGSGR